jgi:NAD(P)-dependent dehydrogenase (short-subunit alcohol dehydrogenase family)
VSNEEQVAAMVQRTVDTYGRLDMAFDNAGIQAPPTEPRWTAAATGRRCTRGRGGVKREARVDC